MGDIPPPHTHRAYWSLCPVLLCSPLAPGPALHCLLRPGERGGEKAVQPVLCREAFPSLSVRRVRVALSKVPAQLEDN